MAETAPIECMRSPTDRELIIPATGLAHNRLQTEKHQMTTLTILLLTAAIEAPLFYLRAIQRAEAAYLDLYNLKG